MAAAGAEAEKKIPITLLSGFLGAGKTTLLREVLQNKGGLKVAVVVNDVAKINIDSKLVRERTAGSKDGDLSECVELQNGCACCNASEELLDALLQLLRVAARRGYAYDRILIELSGVAEPKNIRREFVEASEEGHIALDQAELQTMITVVDSPSFMELYQSRQDINERPDLALENGEGDVDSDRKVVDLLVEQVECADCLVLNKRDVCPAETMESLSQIASTINPKAQVITSEWGKIPLDIVMGPPNNASWVCNADDEDDLREAVRAAKELSKKRKERPEEHGEGHGHGDKKGHGHAHGEEKGHGHAHGEEKGHGHAHGEEKGHGHAHGEGHGEGKGHAHGDAHGEDKGHGGEHGHGHGHSHEHEHNGERPTETTAKTKYGIFSFVYARRRPFHPKRLMKAIMCLPVKVDPQTGASVDEWTFPSLGTPAQTDDSDGAVMKAIIRSKGFVWVANQHRSAQYWSHAGHYFELRALGLWWAATSLDSWPDSGDAGSNEVRKIAADFAPVSEAQGKTCWGDRRQEIVFIGIKMQQEKIEALLDSCLLTDEEMETYAQQAQASHPDVVKVETAGGAPAEA